MAKILVVDDEPSIRLLLRRTLERGGYEVAEAEDGELAVRSQRANPADLVIVDIYMPEKEGLETILELRADARDLKIIAISGGGRAGNLSPLQVAETFGASRTLIKPIEPEALLESVSAVLRQ